MRYTSWPVRIIKFAAVISALLALAACSTEPDSPEYQGLPDSIVSADGDMVFTEADLAEFTRIEKMPETGILLDPYQPQGALYDVGLTRDETTVVWPKTLTQTGKGQLSSGEEYAVTVTYDANRLYHVAVTVDEANLPLAEKTARHCRLLGFTNFLKRMKRRAAAGENMREICATGEKYILNAYGREILIWMYLNVVPGESATAGVYWAYEGDFQPLPEFQPPPPPADFEEQRKAAEELRKKQMEEAQKQMEGEAQAPPAEPGQ